MARVFIPNPMRDLTAGVDCVELSATTVRQAIRALDQRFPGIANRLTQGDGMAPGIAVSVDGALVAQGLLAAVGPNSEIHFLPAIGGG